MKEEETFESTPFLGFYDKTCKKFKDIEYFRGLPYDGDIYCIFYKITGITKIEHILNLINAALVKWYREGKVDIKFNEEENELLVTFKSDVKYDHKAEQLFYHILKSFAGSDGNLTQIDIINSLKFHYNIYQNFSDKILDYIGDIAFSYDSHEESKKILGLKKFIIDFSMIPELGTNEVYLRDKYIEFAILLNCADMINDEFKSLIPFNIKIFFAYINSLADANDIIEENYK